MKNIDSFTLNFWDDGSFNTNRAITELKKHVTWIREAYQFTYEGEHDYDEKLHQNFLERLGAANAAALDNLPNSESKIEQWIEASLSTVVLHLGFTNAAACRGSDYIKNTENPYIRFAEKPKRPKEPSLLFSSYPYKDKEDEICTLFDDELDNSSITEDDEFAAPPVIVWGTAHISDYDVVMRIYKRTLAARGLRYSTIEDAIDQANEDYAQMVSEHPGEKPDWYAQRLEWKSNDRYRATQTKKYRNGNECEVDSILVGKEYFDLLASETRTVEHLVTIEDYYNTLNKTQRKTFNDLQEWSLKDEKISRMLKARAARLPETKHNFLSVERVERFNEPPKPRTVRGLRDYATLEELEQKYPTFISPVAVRFEKPASPTIQYYAKQNKQYT